MEQRARSGETEVHAEGDGTVTPEAIEFVRFCYRRRQVGWPELYDEMSAVASRGLFRGWSYMELAEHGIGFCLDELPRLAALTASIARDERQERSAGRGVARLHVVPAGGS